MPSAPTAPHSWQPTQPISPRADYQATATSQQLSLSQVPDQLSHYQTGSRILEVQNNKKESTDAGSRPRRRGGCILGCLATLVLLLLLVGASWVFVARPYLHDIAQKQLDQAMANAVDLVPSLPAQLPPPGPFIVTDTELNTLIARNLVSSSPVQNAQAHIRSGAIRLTFETYGQPSAMNVTPVLENDGRIVAKNVTLEGIMALVMSPEEMTAMMDRHLAAAQSRINHPIKKFQVQDATINIQLN